MEQPAEEWARVLTDLEPLRMEFEVVSSAALWRGAWIYGAAVLGIAGALSIPALREQEPLLLLPMLFITALLACIPGWYVVRAVRLRPESVAVHGTTMIIRRRSGSREHVSEFDLLRVRDLRAAMGPTGGYLLDTMPLWNRGRGVFPEAVVFSHAGSHWSFGGYSLSPAEATEAVERITEHDRAVRERLGMRLTPNVSSHDPVRAMADPVEGWDPLVPGRFRLF